MELEIIQQRTVLSLTNTILSDIEKFFENTTNNLSSLDLLEENLRSTMQTVGSLISYYTWPSKLEAAASLESVNDLEENLMVSYHYYQALASAASRLNSMLGLVKGELSARR